MMDLTRFEPHKDRLREDYVGNEAGSDEYRETQPGKGLGTIAALLTALTEEFLTADDQGFRTEAEILFARIKEVNDLTHKWLATLNGAVNAQDYTGCDELDPILRIHFDELWRHGEHPYFDTETDIDEWLDDTDEPTKET